MLHEYIEIDRVSSRTVLGLEMFFFLRCWCLNFALFLLFLFHFIFLLIFFFFVFKCYTPYTVSYRVIAMLFTIFTWYELVSANPAQKLQTPTKLGHFFLFLHWLTWCEMCSWTMLLHLLLFPPECSPNLVQDRRKREQKRPIFKKMWANGFPHSQSFIIHLFLPTE